MNLKSLLQFKKVTVPESLGTTEVETIQLWSVRWESRYGEYSGQTRKECEFFTSEIEAKNFETALNNANKLLRNIGERATQVTFAKE